MTDHIDSQVLKQLAEIQGDLAEVKRRVTKLEGDCTVQEKLIASLVADQAQARTHLTQIESRLDCIEQRLEVVEAKQSN